MKPEKGEQRRLLVVDDEPTIVSLLSASLRFVGFDVRTAATGAEALQRGRRLQARPAGARRDAARLRRLRGGPPAARGRRATLPVLFLTARDGVQDKITGLTVGGDDYVTKPFSLEEVVARIRAVLRRTYAGAGRGRPALRCASPTWRLDEETHDVRARRQADRAEPDRVQAAALPAGQRRPGGQQGADPRPRVALRLRRRRPDRRVLHLAAAAQGRHGRPAADPHAARLRLLAAPAASREG